MIKLTKNKHSPRGLKSLNAQVIIRMVRALVAADAGGGNAWDGGDVKVGSDGCGDGDSARMLVMTCTMTVLKMLLARGSGRALTPIACGIHPARRGRATSAKEGWL